MPEPSFTRKYLTYPHVLAIVGSLIWIASAWLPMAWRVDSGEPVNLFLGWAESRSTNLFPISELPSTGETFVLLGVVTLLVGLFRLQYVWLANLLLVSAWVSLQFPYPVGTEDAYAHDAMLLGIVVIWAASLVARHNRRRRELYGGDHTETQTFDGRRVGTDSPSRARYSSGPHLLAILGSLIWIGSACQPVPYLDEGYPPTSFFVDRGYAKYNVGVLGTSDIATGDYLIVVGEVTLILGLFGLRYLAHSWVILWIAKERADRLFEYTGYSPRNVNLGLMLATIILVSASLWEQQRERKAAEVERDGAEGYEPIVTV